MANLITYTCDACGFTGVFREDDSRRCPCCRAPMKEVTAADVDAILAQIDAMIGCDDDEIEMADKAERRTAR